MATKKFMSLDRLQEYDALIKQEIVDSVSGKANASHTHDDRYYTESEIDTKIASVNTSITNITNGSVVVKNAEHATSADSATTATTATSATKATQDGNGKVISSTYETKTDATAKLTEAKSYTDAEIAELAEGFDAVIYAMYDNGNDMFDEDENLLTIRDIAKDEATTSLDSAKSYADTAATKVKNDLLNGAGTAYDTLKELGDLIEDNQDAIDALETIASGKADATHSHAISDVSGLQSALDGKASTSHGTHVSFDSTNKPKMDGTAAFGTSSKVARADHVHPTDTSRASQTDLDALESVVAGKADTGHIHSVATTSVNGFMSTDMVAKLNGIATGATKVTVDSALSSSSTNPVQNKVINTALTNASSAITANTSSISTHTSQISALETKVGDGFEEITSAEIQALFA